MTACIDMNALVLVPCGAEPRLVAVETHLVLLGFGLHLSPLDGLLHLLIVLLQEGIKAQGVFLQHLLRLLQCLLTLQHTT